MGENICKQSSQQGINLKNIQTAWADLCHTHTHTHTNTIKKWVEDLNRHFSKEDIQMAKST